jgi:hypothetical protein
MAGVFAEPEFETDWVTDGRPLPEPDGPTIVSTTVVW